MQQQSAEESKLAQSQMDKKPVPWIKGTWDLSSRHRRVREDGWVALREGYESYIFSYTEMQSAWRTILCKKSLYFSQWPDQLEVKGVDQKVYLRRKNLDKLPMFMAQNSSFLQSPLGLESVWTWRWYLSSLLSYNTGYLSNIQRSAPPSLLSLANTILSNIKGCSSFLSNYHCKQFKALLCLIRSTKDTNYNTFSFYKM